MKCEGNPWVVSTCLSDCRYIYIYTIYIYKKIRNVGRKTCSERRKITLLKDVRRKDVKKRCEEEM